MSHIRISSIEAIEEFENFFSNYFYAEFCEECQGLVSELRCEVEDTALLVDEASRNYQAECDYFYGLDEPEQGDYESLESARNWLGNCRAYSHSIASFSEQLETKLAATESRQSNDWAAACRFLSRAIASAWNYRSIHPVNDSIRLFPGVNKAPSPIGTDSVQPGSSMLRASNRKTLPELPNSMSWVLIDELDWTSVENELTFRKASAEEIRTMLVVFEKEVLPIMQRPGDITLNELYEMDHKDGRTMAPESRAFAYEFIIGTNNGSDVIAINNPEKSQKQGYTWLSGRHRAFIARRMGWKVIPVRLVGKSNE